MKLVFLGDSLTNGSYGGDWVALVAAAFPQHTIVNAGVGGDTLMNMQRRLDDVIVQAPDAVFVMGGGNDAVSYTMPDTRLYYRRTKDIPDGVVTPEQFRMALREILETLHANYIQAFVGLPLTEYNAELIAARQMYNTIAHEEATAVRAPLLDLAGAFMPIQPIQREAVSLAFIQEIGRRQREGFADFENERVRLGYTYTFDGMHLTPASATLFAQRVIAFLREQKW